MDSSAQILIAGGTFIMTFGLLLGIPMVTSRQKSPRAPRYLFAAHLAAIIQGGLLLALTVAFKYSTLSSWVETIAASLMLGGMFFFILGLTVNWLQDVKDAFAEDSFGNKLSSVGVPLILISAVIIFYGVFSSLLG